LTRKKILPLGLAVLLCAVLVCSSAGAAETAGIIDPQKLLFQHPKFDDVARHIAELRRQKGNEIRFILDKETDPEKRADILRTANRETAESEERLMSPIYDDCVAALAFVMQEKNITIVLKKDSVYFGGTDITEDVIERLKAAVSEE
jgi:outer membrane protein